MNEFQPAGQPRRGRPPNALREAQAAPVTPESFPASSGPKPTAKFADTSKPQSAPSVRAEATRASRRRRKDTGALAGLKLHVPEELKEPGFEYRWINDDGRRIHGKTVDDDWDVVTTPAIEGTGEGTPVTRLVGKAEGGQPLKAFLCRKPMEFYQEDKAKEQRRIKEAEDAMKRGALSTPEGLKGPTTYIPDKIGTSERDYSSNAQGVNRIGE